MNSSIKSKGRARHHKLIVCDTGLFHVQSVVYSIINKKYMVKIYMVVMRMKTGILELLTGTGGGAYGRTEGTRRKRDRTDFFK